MSAAPELSYGQEPMESPRHLEPVPSELLNEVEQWSPLVLNTGTEPNLGELMEYAQETQSSELLLVKTMEATGLSTAKAAEAEVEGKVEITVDEADICIESLQKLRALPETEARKLVAKASKAYHEDYCRENERIDINAIIELTDQTERYEESSLLSTMQQLRTAVKKGKLENTVVEAERIARVMILQEQETLNRRQVLDE